MYPDNSRQTPLRPRHVLELTLLYNPLPSGSANTTRTSSLTDFRNCPTPEIVPPVPTKRLVYFRSRLYLAFVFMLRRTGSMETDDARATLSFAGRYVMGPKKFRKIRVNGIFVRAGVKPRRGVKAPPTSAGQGTL
jgi:hypothetical protein